jgi:hypothetical protein
MFSQGQLVFAGGFFCRVCCSNDVCLSKRFQFTPYILQRKL